MRIVYLGWLVVLVSFCGCNSRPNPEAAKPNLESARSVSDQIGRAINSKDAGKLKANLADDALFIRANGPAVSRDDFIYSYENGFKGINYNVSFSSEEIAPAGEFVIARGSFRGDIKSVDGRAAAPVSGKYLHVLKGQPDGSWKIWRGAWEFDSYANWKGLSWKLILLLYKYKCR